MRGDRSPRLSFVYASLEWYINGDNDVVKVVSRWKGIDLCIIGFVAQAYGGNNLLVASFLENLF